jgi:hypothetical protein
MDRRVEKLCDDNYIDWSSMMQSYLEVNDIWTIDDEVPANPGNVAPEAADALRVYNERIQERQRWRKADRKARNYINLCVDQTNGILIRSVHGGKEAWQVLREYHLAPSMSRKVNLTEKLYGMKIGQSDDMRKHLAKMEEMFYKLQNMGQPVDEQSKVTLILKSVRGEYETLVTAMSVWTDAQMTIRNIKDRLIEEFDKKKESAYFHHGSSTVPHRGGVAATNGSSTLPKRYARKSEEFTNCFFMSSRSSHHWIVDSGATKHMTAIESSFTTLNRRHRSDRNGNSCGADESTRRKLIKV